MADNPTISVIIPAYQAAGMIGRALDSVLGQSHSPAEILVIDDGSTDDLAGAVRKYGDKVTLIRKANGGAAEARNLGLDRARGDLIAFLDADDYWLPEKLHWQVEVFARFPQAGIVGSAWYQEKPGGERRMAERTFFSDQRFLDRLLPPAKATLVDIVNRLHICSILVRRNVLGVERFLPPLRMGEDRDLFFRLVSRAPTYLISQPLATVVLVPGSVSRHPERLDSDCRDLLWVDRRNATLMDNRGRRRNQAMVFHKWARGHLRADRPRSALLPALLRLRVEPFSPHAWWTAAKATTLSCFKRS